jgi:transcriptional regulator with XRE-family HTH domain
MSILNGDAVRRRRLEMGMSERALAKALGVTSGVISALEDGTNHRTLKLGFVDTLASQLGVGVASLLLRPKRSAAEALPAPDDRVSSAATALVMAGGSASVEALATATGSTLAEIGVTLRDLEAQLAPVSISVARTSAGLVRLRCDRSDASDLADRLSEAEVAGRGLGHSHARVLYEIAQGRADAKWQREGGESRRLAVGFLERSGLVARTEKGLVLTDAARLSLGVSAQ